MKQELYLIAQIAGAKVAISAEQVESVVDIGAVTAVPRAGQNVRGLAALRSRVVTVIDTQAALGLPGDSNATRAVITKADGHQYAMLVDVLDDVAPFEAVPMGLGLSLDPEWRAAGIGLIEKDGEPILIIDLAVIVPDQSSV